MALNAPKLLKLLQEAQAKIAELEAREPVVVERVVEVVGPEMVVEKEVVREVPVYHTEYKDREKLVPFEIEKIVYRDVEKVVEVPGPERVVEKLVPFEVKVPMYPHSVQRVEVERVVYQDNPEHLETIRKLQEKLCQYTSQSDS